MVSEKRHGPPPECPISKAPRLASWQNHARSCFAIDPTRAVTRPTYIHWREDPNHKVMLSLSDITVAAGALPPYSSTSFHSHHHTTFVLSIIDTPVVTFQNLQPPNYTHRQEQQFASLTSGACFSQCPFSSKLPFVHRGITTHHRVAFLMIESSASPLCHLAPPFVVAESSAVSTENRAPSNFWAAAKLSLDSGAEATLESRHSSCPLPLARFICRLQCSLDNLKIQIPKHLRRDAVETSLAGTFLQTIVISGFKDTSDTCLRILNTGPNAWSGVVVDIFGTTSL